MNVNGWFEVLVLSKQFTECDKEDQLVELMTHCKSFMMKQGGDVTSSKRRPGGSSDCSDLCGVLYYGRGGNSRLASVGSR